MLTFYMDDSERLFEIKRNIQNSKYVKTKVGEIKSDN